MHPTIDPQLWATYQAQAAAGTSAADWCTFAVIGIVALLAARHWRARWLGGAAAFLCLLVAGRCGTAMQAIGMIADPSPAGDGHDIVLQAVAYVFACVTALVVVAWTLLRGAGRMMAHVFQP